MKERVIAQRTARTVARIVQLQALKLAVENQRLLAVQKKGGIIKSNRASRSANVMGAMSVIKEKSRNYRRPGRFLRLL
jgi:lipase chaperone LimK